MKVFISWSGDRSRIAAEALRDWLPQIINAAEPWLSSSDIEPGSRWGADVAKNLEETHFGIICITQENQAEPWILFEAGALSKAVESSKVVPFLLDIAKADLQGPLTQFQAVGPTHDDFLRLAKSISQALIDAKERPLDEKVLTRGVDQFWPRIQEALSTIPKRAGAGPAARTDRQILEEVLLIVRGIPGLMGQFELRRPSAGTGPDRTLFAAYAHLEELLKGAADDAQVGEAALTLVRSIRAWRDQTSESKED